MDKGLTAGECWAKWLAADDHERRLRVSRREMIRAAAPVDEIAKAREAYVAAVESTDEAYERYTTAKIVERACGERRAVNG